MLQEELLRRGLMAHDLVQILSQHDLDDSGELEYPEFKQLCRQLGVAIAPSELRDVFNALDKDHRGNMSRRQLEAGLRKVGLGKQLTASDFESIAEAFDADGDDRINLHGEWVR